VAEFDKVIPPGQEGKIHLVIDAKRVHSHFDKNAKVYSNDPEHPMTMIYIAGTITPLISITPSARLYLQGHYGETVKKRITFKSNENDLDFAITKIESNIDDKITYDFSPGAEDQTWVIDVWKNPTLPTMNMSGAMTVYTNSELAPTKSLNVQVVTKSLITVVPAAVNFGRVKFGSGGEAGRPVTRNLVVRKSAGEFTIEDVAFSTDHFVGEIESSATGTRYNIKVTFQPPQKKKPNQTHIGWMTIRTDDPREPELKVRLVARSM